MRSAPRAPKTAVIPRLLERGGGHRIEPAVAFNQPSEGIIMMHHRLGIGADLQIDLDRVARRDGGRDRRGRVLDHAGGGIMQPAMGDRARDQPIQP